MTKPVKVQIKARPRDRQLFGHNQKGALYAGNPEAAHMLIQGDQNDALRITGQPMRHDEKLLMVNNDATGITDTFNQFKHKFN